MTPFIIFLVAFLAAAPVVFWLFRRRQRRGAGVRQDEREDVTVSAEATEPGSHVTTAPTSICAADDVMGAPVPESASPHQDGIERIDQPAGGPEPGQATVAHTGPISSQADHSPLPYAAGEGEKSVISKTEFGNQASGVEAKESAPSWFAPDIEAVPANVMAEEETSAPAEGPLVDGDSPSHDAEPAEEAEAALPIGETGHAEESVLAGTGISSSPGEPLDITNLPDFGESEPEPVADETAVSAEDAHAYVTGSPASDETESLQVAAEGGYASSEEPAADVEPAELSEPEPVADETAVSAEDAHARVTGSPASEETESLQVAAAEGGYASSEEPFADVEPVELEDISVAEPSRYRPPPQRQQMQRPPARTGSATRGSVGSLLEIRVRLTLDRFGFCQISLLPERKHDMDDEIAVKAGAMRLTLAAQEDWYGDLYFDDIGERLRQGIRLGGLLSDGRRVQWQLSGGRDIYVLAGHPSASGFISVPRLAVGRSHAVLCANGILEQAEAILEQAGCNGYTKLDASHGVPDGWTGLRGVLPETALTLDAGIDPFYALKPAPDIDISLEGGLLFHDSVWLSGYPPQIRVTGQTTGALRVLIDGQEAHATDGCYTAAGFDAPGPHRVECEGLSCSRSYSMEEPAESWEEWAAYTFSSADVCGPVVTLRAEARGSRIFTVPMTNPLLLGAEPGQVFRCSRRNVANWQGFVPFDVVWALPAQPLICDKKTSRILRFSSAPAAPANREGRPPLGWSSAILDASRKGLRIEDGSPDSAAQWIEYKKTARNIWRGRR